MLNNGVKRHFARSFKMRVPKIDPSIQDQVNKGGQVTQMIDSDEDVLRFLQQEGIAHD